MLPEVPSAQVRRETQRQVHGSSIVMTPPMFCYDTYRHVSGVILPGNREFFKVNYGELTLLMLWHRSACKQNRLRYRLGRHSCFYHGRRGVVIHGSLDRAWLHASQGHDTRSKLGPLVSWSTPCPDMTYCSHEIRRCCRPPTTTDAISQLHMVHCVGTIEFDPQMSQLDHEEESGPWRLVTVFSF